MGQFMKKVWLATTLLTLLITSGCEKEEASVEQKVAASNTTVVKSLKEQQDEKQKEERPWLYDGTPQVHTRSKYVADLMKNDIFPKVVK